MALVREPRRVYDVRERKAVADQPARLLNPDQLEILVWRQPERCAEDADEVERADPRFARELADRHGSRVLCLEQLTHSAKCGGRARRRYRLSVGRRTGRVTNDDLTDRLEQRALLLQRVGVAFE